MVKSAYIFYAWGNMSIIQMKATPPLHPQALSDAGVTALQGRAYSQLMCASVVVQFQYHPKMGGGEMTKLIALIESELIVLLLLQNRVWVGCATKATSEICIWINSHAQLSNATDRLDWLTSLTFQKILRAESESAGWIWLWRIPSTFIIKHWQLKYSNTTTTAHDQLKSYWILIKRQNKKWGYKHTLCNFQNAALSSGRLPRVNLRYIIHDIYYKSYSQTTGGPQSEAKLR